MKKIKFLAVVCCMAAVFTACENDTKSKIEELENRIEGLENGGNSDTGNDTDQNGGNSNTGSDNATGTANGHGYVDLGLPSGTKWATCNVGATKPEEYGDYYAWGEIITKRIYNWSTYEWCNGSKTTLTKYNTSSSYGTVDKKKVLELADDVARANWGGKWRMPTDAEWTELLDNCTWTLTRDYNGTGVAGRIVTSKINGGTIFLPAAGHRDDDDLYYAGSSGCYWSSSLDTGIPYYALYMDFSSFNVYTFFNYRYYGQSVRPVL